MCCFSASKMARRRIRLTFGAREKLSDGDFADQQASRKQRKNQGNVCAGKMCQAKHKIRGVYLTNFSSSKVRQQATKGVPLKMKILVSESEGVRFVHYSKTIALRWEKGIWWMVIFDFLQLMYSFYHARYTNKVQITMGISFLLHIFILINQFE